MWFPVYASAEFEADIDVKGKTKEEIFNLFIQECDSQSSGLCHRCAKDHHTDYEMVTDIAKYEDFEEELDDALAGKE
jgi:hypothetical protein